jgi:hypothetical protein
MNDDFYHSEIDKPLLEARNKYISERWEQLYNVSTNAAEEAQKYLFWVNSGGAVAVLGFIGANSEAAKSWGAKGALILFCIGLVFVGILHARVTHRFYKLFNDWRKNTALYYNQKIGYSKLTADDEEKTNSDFWEFLIAYFSFGAFLLGLIVGGITLLK